MALRQAFTWTEQHAARRGQYWADGPKPGTVWALPFAAAPWEDGRPAFVLLDTRRGVSYAASWRPGDPSPPRT